MTKYRNGKQKTKFPKLNKSYPNKHIAYVRTKHQEFIFGMIASGEWKTQSEGVNSAYREYEDNYIARNTQSKYDEIIAKGREVLKKLLPEKPPTRKQQLIERNRNKHL